MAIEQNENNLTSSEVERTLGNLEDSDAENLGFEATGELFAQDEDLELLDFDESMLVPVPQITYVGGDIPAGDNFIDGVPSKGTVEVLSTLDSTKVGEKTVQLKVTVGGKEYFKTSKLTVLTPENYFNQKSKIEKLNAIKDEAAPDPEEFIQDLPKDWTVEYVTGTPNTSNKGEQNVQILIKPDKGGRPFTKMVKLSVHEKSEFTENMLLPVNQTIYEGADLPSDEEFIKGVPAGGTVEVLSTLDNSKAGEKTVQLKVTAGGKEYFKTSKMTVLTPENYFNQKSKINKVSVIKDEAAPDPKEFVKDMPKDWTVEYVTGNPNTNAEGEQNVQILIKPDKGGRPFTKMVKLSVV